MPIEQWICPYIRLATLPFSSKLIRLHIHTHIRLGSLLYSSWMCCCCCCWRNTQPSLGAVIKGDCLKNLFLIATFDGIGGFHNEPSWQDINLKLKWLTIYANSCLVNMHCYSRMAAHLHSRSALNYCRMMAILQCSVYTFSTEFLQTLPSSTDGTLKIVCPNF